MDPEEFDLGEYDSYLNDNEWNFDNDLVNELLMNQSNELPSFLQPHGGSSQPVEYGSADAPAIEYESFDLPYMSTQVDDTPIEFQPSWTTTTTTTTTTTQTTSPGFHRNGSIDVHSTLLVGLDSKRDVVFRTHIMTTLVKILEVLEPEISKRLIASANLYYSLNAMLRNADNTQIASNIESMSRAHRIAEGADIEKTTQRIASLAVPMRMYTHYSDCVISLCAALLSFIFRAEEQNARYNTTKVSRGVFHGFMVQPPPDSNDRRTIAIDYKTDLDSLFHVLLSGSLNMCILIYEQLIQLGQATGPRSGHPLPDVKNDDQQEQKQTLKSIFTLLFACIKDVTVFYTGIVDTMSQKYTNLYAKLYEHRVDALADSAKHILHPVQYPTEKVDAFYTMIKSMTGVPESLSAIDEPTAEEVTLLTDDEFRHLCSSPTNRLHDTLRKQTKAQYYYDSSLIAASLVASSSRGSRHDPLMHTTGAGPGLPVSPDTVEDHSEHRQPWGSVFHHIFELSGAGASVGFAHDLMKLFTNLTDTTAAAEFMHPSVRVTSRGDGTHDNIGPVWTDLKAHGLISSTESVDFVPLEGFPMPLHSCDYSRYTPIRLFFITFTSTMVNQTSLTSATSSSGATQLHPPLCVLKIACLYDNLTGRPVYSILSHEQYVKHLSSDRLDPLSDFPADVRMNEAAKLFDDSNTKNTYAEFNQNYTNTISMLSARGQRHLPGYTNTLTITTAMLKAVLPRIAIITYHTRNLVHYYFDIAYIQPYKPGDPHRYQTWGCVENQSNQPYSTATTTTTTTTTTPFHPELAPVMCAPNNFNEATISSPSHPKLLQYITCHLASTLGVFATANNESLPIKQSWREFIGTPTLPSQPKLNPHVPNISWFATPAGQSVLTSSVPGVTNSHNRPPAQHSDGGECSEPVIFWQNVFLAEAIVQNNQTHFCEMSFSQPIQRSSEQKSNENLRHLSPLYPLLYNIILTSNSIQSTQLLSATDDTRESLGDNERTNAITTMSTEVYWRAHLATEQLCLSSEAPWTLLVGAAADGMLLYSEPNVVAYFLTTMAGILEEMTWRCGFNYNITPMGNQSISQHLSTILEYIINAQQKHRDLTALFHTSPQDTPSIWRRQIDRVNAFIEPDAQLSSPETSQYYHYYVSAPRLVTATAGAGAHVSLVPPAVNKAVQWIEQLNLVDAVPTMKKTRDTDTQIRTVVDNTMRNLLDKAQPQSKSKPQSKSNPSTTELSKSMTQVILASHNGTIRAGADIVKSSLSPAAEATVQEAMMAHYLQYLNVESTRLDKFKGIPHCWDMLDMSEYATTGQSQIFNTENAQNLSLGKLYALLQGQARSSSSSPDDDNNSKASADTHPVTKALLANLDQIFATAPGFRISGSGENNPDSDTVFWDTVANSPPLSFMMGFPKIMDSNNIVLTPDNILFTHVSWFGRQIRKAKEEYAVSSSRDHFFRTQSFPDILALIRLITARLTTDDSSCKTIWLLQELTHNWVWVYPALEQAIKILDVYYDHAKKAINIKNAAEKTQGQIDADIRDLDLKLKTKLGELIGSHPGLLTKIKQLDIRYLLSYLAERQAIIVFGYLESKVREHAEKTANVIRNMEDALERSKEYNAIANNLKKLIQQRTVVDQNIITEETRLSSLKGDPQGHSSEQIKWVEAGRNKLLDERNEIIMWYNYLDAIGAQIKLQIFQIITYLKTLLGEEKTKHFANIDEWPQLFETWLIAYKKENDAKNAQNSIIIRAMEYYKKITSEKPTGTAKGLPPSENLTIWSPVRILESETRRKLDLLWQVVLNSEPSTPVLQILKQGGVVIDIRANKVGPNKLTEVIADVYKPNASMSTTTTRFFQNMLEIENVLLTFRNFIVERRQDGVAEVQRASVIRALLTDPYKLEALLSTGFSLMFAQPRSKHHLYKFLLYPGAHQAEDTISMADQVNTPNAYLNEPSHMASFASIRSLGLWPRMSGEGASGAIPSSMMVGKGKNGSLSMSDSFISSGALRNTLITLDSYMNWEAYKLGFDSTLSGFGRVRHEHLLLKSTTPFPLHLSDQPAWNQPASPFDKYASMSPLKLVESVQATLLESFNARDSIQHALTEDPLAYWSFYHKYFGAQSLLRYVYHLFMGSLIEMLPVLGHLDISMIFATCASHTTLNHTSTRPHLFEPIEWLFVLTWDYFFAPVINPYRSVLLDPSSTTTTTTTTAPLHPNSVPSPTNSVIDILFAHDQREGNAHTSTWGIIDRLPKPWKEIFIFTNKYMTQGLTRKQIIEDLVCTVCAHGLCFFATIMVNDFYGHGSMFERERASPSTQTPLSSQTLKIPRYTAVTGTTSNTQAPLRYGALLALKEIPKRMHACSIQLQLACTNIMYAYKCRLLTQGESGKIDDHHPIEATTLTPAAATGFTSSPTATQPPPPSIPSPFAATQHVAPDATMLHTIFDLVRSMQLYPHYLTYAAPAKYINNKTLTTLRWCLSTAEDIGQDTQNYMKTQTMATDAALVGSIPIGSYNVDLPPFVGTRAVGGSSGTLLRTRGDAAYPANIAAYGADTNVNINNNTIVDGDGGTSVPRIEVRRLMYYDETPGDISLSGLEILEKIRRTAETHEITKKHFEHTQSLIYPIPPAEILTCNSLLYHSNPHVVYLDPNVNSKGSIYDGNTMHGVLSMNQPILKQDTPSDRLSASPHDIIDLLEYSHLPALTGYDGVRLDNPLGGAPWSMITNYSDTPIFVKDRTTVNAQQSYPNTYGATDHQAFFKSIYYCGRTMPFYTHTRAARTTLDDSTMNQPSHSRAQPSAVKMSKAEVTGGLFLGIYHGNSLFPPSNTGHASTPITPPSGIGLQVFYTTANAASPFFCDSSLDFNGFWNDMDIWVPPHDANYYDDARSSQPLSAAPPPSNSSSSSSSSSSSVPATMSVFEHMMANNWLSPEAIQTLLGGIFPQSAAGLGKEAEATSATCRKPTSAVNTPNTALAAKFATLLNGQSFLMNIRYRQYEEYVKADPSLSLLLKKDGMEHPVLPRETDGGNNESMWRAVSVRESVWKRYTLMRAIQGLILRWITWEKRQMALHVSTITEHRYTTKRNQNIAFGEDVTSQKRWHTSMTRATEEVAGMRFLVKMHSLWYLHKYLPKDIFKCDYQNITIPTAIECRTRCVPTVAPYNIEQTCVPPEYTKDAKDVLLRYYDSLSTPAPLAEPHQTILDLLHFLMAMMRLAVLVASAAPNDFVQYKHEGNVGDVGGLHNIDDYYEEEQEEVVTIPPMPRPDSSNFATSSLFKTDILTRRKLTTMQYLITFLFDRYALHQTWCNLLSVRTETIALEPAADVVDTTTTTTTTTAAATKSNTNNAQLPKSYDVVIYTLRDITSVHTLPKRAQPCTGNDKSFDIQSCETFRCSNVVICIPEQYLSRTDVPVGALKVYMEGTAPTRRQEQVIVHKVRPLIYTKMVKLLHEKMNKMREMMYNNPNTIRAYMHTFLVQSRLTNSIGYCHDFKTLLLLSQKLYDDIIAAINAVKSKKKLKTQTPPTETSKFQLTPASTETRIQSLKLLMRFGFNYEIIVYKIKEERAQTLLYFWSNLSSILPLSQPPPDVYHKPPPIDMDALITTALATTLARSGIVALDTNIDIPHKFRINKQCLLRGAPPPTQQL